MAPEGFESTSTCRQLAVVGEPVRPEGRSRRSSLPWGLLWCSIGSVSIALAPVVANVLVAYGMAVAMWDRGRREQMVVLAAALAMGSAGAILFASVYDIVTVALSVLVAFATVRLCATRRMAAGTLLALAVVTSLVMLGTDLVSTSQAQTTIAEAYTEMVNGAIDANAEALDLDAMSAMLEARDMLAVYWPSLYFACGLAVVVFSLVGARSGIVASGGDVERGAIARFDAPRWVTALFALGVAADMLSARLPFGANTAAFVGANVVVVCRIVLAQQGLSVLIWWLREHRVGLLLRAFLLFAALWLELSVALMSLVGMFDTVFNYRRLPRRGERPVVEPINERE